MNEFELIQNYFQREAKKNIASNVLLGIGDDCALVAVPSGKQLAISVDTLVADVHFPLHADAADIAQRALRVNLSDLAAMGAKPLWFTLALTLPKNSALISEEWIQNFSRGLFECAREFNIHLIGGDTTSGALSITIQVMGEVEASCALKRSGAKPDDAIYVTHCLGDGAAALEIILNQTAAEKISTTQQDYLIHRFYRPAPRLVEALHLLGVANSALDISDGLVADLHHICRASNLAAVIHVEDLPISDATLALQGLDKARISALSGGDDYELCFTVSQEQEKNVVELIKTKKLIATRIGEMKFGEGVRCELNGNLFELSREGYEHFSNCEIN